MDVTTYELLDLMASWKADTASNVLNLTTAYSAYILAAYTAGAKLTRAQVVVISGLLIWYASIAITQLSINLRSLLEFTTLDYEGGHGGQADILVWGVVARWAIVSGSVLALFSCLYFMWSIRHPKTEQNH
jgi:hypothetical protein